MLFLCRFDDRNLERLWIKNEGIGIDKLIDFIKCIDWEDYFMNIYICGFIIYVFEK